MTASPSSNRELTAPPSSNRELTAPPSSNREQMKEFSKKRSRGSFESLPSACEASLKSGSTSKSDRLLKPTEHRLEKPNVKEGQVGLNDLGEGAHVIYVPDAFERERSKELFHRLSSGIPWEQKEIRMMGRPILQPRLIAYMADDPSMTYTYSGSTLHPTGWTDDVLKIKKKIEEVAGVTFNSCLLNHYRNGQDHLSWHSDNERLYGPSPTIGSVSLGATRDFMMKSILDPPEKYCFPLGGGAALVMRGTVQDRWLHCVPKRARVKDARINLTFRSIICAEKAAH
ncbi:hypothetical protein CYMTET_15777 [Cymbomonas tetramitiformis]|uniref:Fe2OG dioxygenase domain-containing protein n=1 Tax=Cymbomonas tetramitiformis TaxID=36881 RepID=A0AAE0GDR1_9CHLO|nr:hypothetical protein CYMTET_15777 [Cymbomonas tetramitiformis]